MADSGHDHRKYAHKSFRIEQQIQLWIEESCDGNGFDLVTKNNLPGQQPIIAGHTDTLIEARVLMDALFSTFSLNLIEGSVVDVLELKR